MGLRAVYTTIEAQLTTIQNNGNNAFRHFHVWNEDVDDLKNGKEVLWLRPACLMEVIVEDIEQMGNGNQRLNLIVNLHIIHELLHAGSEFEQNYEVFDLADATYFAMQQWKATANMPLSEFIRIGEKQDFHHDNLYHFIQTYKSTYIDLALDSPVYGTYVVKAPPITLTINPIIP